MYKVDFLNIAKQDLREIAFYIKNELQNPLAANNVIEKIIEEAEKLSDFPYSHPVHIPIRPLKKEYRKVPVKNYLIFYTVDESAKTVTISRIIYAKRNIMAQMIENT